MNSEKKNFKYYLINGFFGWNNFKWVVKELIKMYSNKESFFSYKRFQTGIAFLTYQIGSRHALYNYVNDVGDFLMWASAELLICGYTLSAIQKEKRDTNGEV